MQIKAQIARPAMNDVVPAGSTYLVQGAAWGGEADLVRVEVSSNGGAVWRDAKLLGEAVRNAWRFWEFSWQTPAQPGNCTLMARATDANGRTQPTQRIADYGTYMVNHVLPIEVQVR